MPARRSSSCFPIVLAAIFVLLTMTFRSASEASIVMLSVLYAMTGGVILQWLLGYNFSVAVWIGYIALYGVAVETGVVMVDLPPRGAGPAARPGRRDPGGHPRSHAGRIGPAPAPEAHDGLRGDALARSDLLVHGNRLRGHAPDRGADRGRDDHLDDPRPPRDARHLLPDEGASPREGKAARLGNEARAAGFGDRRGAVEAATNSWPIRSRRGRSGNAPRDGRSSARSRRSRCSTPCCRVSRSTPRSGSPDVHKP